MAMDDTNSNDLIELTHLHEPAVVATIQKRYADHTIHNKHVGTADTVTRSSMCTTFKESTAVMRISQKLDSLTQQESYPH
eukprot:2457778-Ditylum_brightwellii.AAC.1